jgi:hypothetical protein
MTVLPTDKPIALDICCRKGGATVGLQRAGFYVIGVDIDPQPGYPGDEFYQVDGIEILKNLLTPYGSYSLDLIAKRPDLIWQSWPCQEGNTATAGNRARGIVDTHEQFIPRARELSDRLGIPYVLEQPTSSRRGLIRRDLTLCMDMFKRDLPPPWVQKHRSFELHGFVVPQPEHPAGPVRGGSMAGFPKPAGHAGYVRGHRHGIVRGGDEAPYVAGYGDGGGKATAGEIAHAMGIDWMIAPGPKTKAQEKAERFDLCEAIPPVFAEHIGRSFLSSRCSYVDGYGFCGKQTAYLPHADGGAGWGWRHVDADFDQMCHCVEQGYPGPHPRSEGCAGAR